MSENALSREDLGTQYLSLLPFTPYPVQEDALLAWFMSEQGVMVCAPTGTGKTLIAEAALYEALHTGKVAYYTTPLIALTEQKFAEMQKAAVSWGFQAEDVGLVTGNRRVNPDAKVLVVVAEILLNRLLNPEAYDFSQVSAVVMDEFHNFADPYRGIVWELALGLLPREVRLLLLSATVGNSLEFMSWLYRCHGRKLELVEGTERKVPLTYVWVEDELLNEQITRMAQGDAASRLTPALVFCFNRDECWSIAEQLKGCSLVHESTRAELSEAVNSLDFSQGVGPKLKQLLVRGVGVHHAGMLPKYRRIVEDLFQRKLLSVCICTETLAAGINLPARSVVLTSLVKGPPNKKKVIDASSAHQIFGRAGRPQYDTQGYVFSLAHEDDVKILRWKKKFDAIPEDTKDPGLLKAKKALKKKKPTRREAETYWNESQFDKLKLAPPTKLYSKGNLPWRLLAYLLAHSPEVDRIRRLIRKRLMDEPRIEAGEAALDQMLLTLHAAGYVQLDPLPPVMGEKEEEPPPATPVPAATGMFSELLAAQHAGKQKGEKKEAAPREVYRPVLAKPKPEMANLLFFRSVNPLYGCFLVKQLGIADKMERLQALESVLGIPGPLLRYVRVPWEIPTGPLASTRLDEQLIRRGLMVAPTAPNEDEEEQDTEERKNYPVVLADKLRLLFDADYPGVTDVETQPVWTIGELMNYGGNFNNYIKAQDLTKQEGIIFRHLLRFILLCEEFAQVCPPELTFESWQDDLREMAEQVAETCRQVDPTSTDEMLQAAHAADVVEGESHAKTK